MKRKPDFAGWVTKNDIQCSDGVIIRRDAFKHNDGTKVPLVWQHKHNDPLNVIGHILLHNRDEGVYGYGFLNGTEQGQSAKELLKHGDIDAMSIAANRIQRKGANVIHGNIFEVSLVLSGANPGATIEKVMVHSDEDDEFYEVPDEAIIYPDTVIHTDIEYEEGGSEMDNEELEHEEESEKTIGDVLKTLTDEQMAAVESLLANALADEEEPDESEEESVQQSDIIEEDESMKRNVFDGTMEQEEVITHGELNEVLTAAVNSHGKLKDAMIEHGITNIELLFPDAKYNTSEPQIYKDPNTNASKIIGGVKKVPFSKIKNLVADFTDEEARARGYIKGKEKVEQVFDLLTRSTSPQTIYKKQKLDRDDIVDITDFNIVAFIQKEMRFMLEEELARAILVGDGRQKTSPDKIKEEHIRPIINDDDFYAVKKTTASAAKAIEDIIKAMADYRGSGMPSLYAHPNFIADLKLLKANDGRFLFGDIPTEAAIASRLGVRELVPTTFMPADKFIIVNLADYTVGATKGGEVTTFDDFDIDFNQYKYLIETRCSGALLTPMSALVFTVVGEAQGQPAPAPVGDK